MDSNNINEKRNTNSAIKLRIQNLLKQKNMTQYRLTMKSGVPHSTLSNIMNKIVDDNKFSTIIMIANGFDMTVSEFLDDPIFIDLAESL